MIRTVATSAIRDAVRGHERAILAALGIDLPRSGTHRTCPFPDHDDANPSWRWDHGKARAFCTCTDRRALSIFDVIQRAAGIDFAEAKLRAAEIIDRPDLIAEPAPKMTAESLLAPPANQADPELPRRYLAHRLGIEPGEVIVPATPAAGWRALPYFDPPATKGGRYKAVANPPCAVFGTAAIDGRRHAHRLYTAPGGAGKAELGEGRDPKKSAPGPARGCVAWWGDPTTAPWLLLCEGIETAAAVAYVFAPELDRTEAAVVAGISDAGVANAEPWPATVRATVCADRDEAKRGPGYQAGERAARKFAGRAEVPVALALPGEAGTKTDWLDNLARYGAEAVRAGILAAEAKAEPTGQDDAEAELERLTRLGPFDYGRERAAAAQRLGVALSYLDREIAARRGEQEGEQVPGQGRPITFPEVEPWPEPVDGAALIDGLVCHVRRFVIMSESAAVAVALWAIHTWAHDAAFISPRLLALSPTKRCGKSSLLRWLASVVRRPRSTSNISASALFRVIEAAKPTLILDEMDSVGDGDKAEELRNLVNASHCVLDATVIRAVKIGDGHEPREFSAWAPMALAYIKAVPDTIRDRSIVIPMQRKAPDQAVEHVRRDRDQGFADLARRCARWAGDHMTELRGADPQMPDGLHDRAADNWRALLAVADLAGGQWPERARKAAVALSVEADDDDTVGVELLRDLQTIFAEAAVDRLSSDFIVQRLVAMEGRPWCEFGRAEKPITKNTLARLLKPFKVYPGTVRLADGTTPKGYRRESFSDLWDRYFPTTTPPHRRETAASSDSQNATPESDVAVANPPNARKSATCGDVAVGNGGIPADGESSHCTDSYPPWSEGEL